MLPASQFNGESGLGLKVMHRITAITAERRDYDIIYIYIYIFMHIILYRPHGHHIMQVHICAGHSAYHSIMALTALATDLRSQAGDQPSAPDEEEGFRMSRQTSPVY
jgi:hypothetical protein